MWLGANGTADQAGVREKLPITSPSASSSSATPFSPKYTMVSMVRQDSPKAAVWDKAMTSSSRKSIIDAQSTTGGSGMDSAVRLQEVRKARVHTGRIFALGEYASRLISGDPSGQSSPSGLDWPRAGYQDGLFGRSEQ